MAEIRRVEVPSEDDLRLAAWANAEMGGTFVDPCRPESEVNTTLGLAIRSLAREVQWLRARVAVLEADRGPDG
jgi:hypothetical protein